MNHARRFVPPAVFILLSSFLILPILWKGKMLYGHDVVSVFHYQRIVIAEAFREGRLPVWDPHVMAGFPLLAGVQGAVFYPPTWLCVLMSAGTFWTLSAWAHLILAGIFAHRWLERGLGIGPWAALAGAVVFMLSGYIVGHLYAGHVNYVWAYPWMAALLWRLERYLAAPTLKRGVLLAVVLAMLFLAGVPQFVFFAGLMVLARGLHFVLADREGRKDRAMLTGKCVAWLALGLLFCSPQLFPTLELIGQMQGGAREDETSLEQYSLPIGHLHRLGISPIVAADPAEFRNPMEGAASMEWSGYVGGAFLLLAVAAFIGKHPQRRLWCGVAILGIVLALGVHVPFYKGFVAVVPGAGLFRAPGRYLLLFTVAVVAMVAMGVDACRTRSRPLQILAAVLALIGGWQLVDFGRHCFYRVKEADLVFQSHTAVALGDRCGLEGRIASAYAPVQVIGKCQAAGLDHVGGYEPMMLRRYAELMNAARGASPSTPIVVLASVGRHPVVDMLSVRLWLGGKFSENSENPLPRAWIVNNAAILESKEERLNVLAKGPWDPRKTVILEQYPTEAPPVTTEGPAGRAKVVSRRPGEYVLEAENGADAYLVLSEAYYPGWTAEVDGKPVEVVPANHLIQAIRLSPGKHVVRFAYRSRFLGAGLASALLAALAPAAIVLVRRRRR